MTRFKCTCAYDGTAYFGWQSQVGGNTVQDVIEAKLEAIFKKHIRVHGGSRTDSGVHARGFVFHIDADWAHDAEALKRALSVSLPGDIQLKAVEAVTQEFHARFSAKVKQYAYYIHKGYADPFGVRYHWSLGGRELDVYAMASAAAIFLGEHDFSAFGAYGGAGSEENPVKTIYRSEIIDDGDVVRYVTEGSGYLYKMVRTMVGGLVDVGLGKLSKDDLVHILETRVRTESLKTAPAKGLFLQEVRF